MTTKPKTRKAPAGCGINPRLIALAAKRDKTNAVLARVLDEVLNPSNRRLSANREDKAAKAGVVEAHRLESAACEAVELVEKRFSAIRATNMNDLVFKARQVAKEADEGLDDYRLVQSIVGDLLAIGGKP